MSECLGCSALRAQLAALEERVVHMEKARALPGLDEQLTLEEAHELRLVRVKPELLRRWYRNVETREAELLEELLVRVGCHLYTTRARAANWTHLRAEAARLKEAELSRLLDEDRGAVFVPRRQAREPRNARPRPNAGGMRRHSR